MPNERRTKPLYLLVRPSVDAAIRADAAARGQPLNVWVERMVEAALIRQKAVPDEVAA